MGMYFRSYEMIADNLHGPLLKWAYICKLSATPFYWDSR